MIKRFSLIICFRNREIDRINNSLKSLVQQTLLDFEVVFVDYGSEKEVAEQAKRLVDTFPFTKYIYSDTRGWFWNRAHALNTGIKVSTGNIIIISDIDLIFPPDYLENLNKLSFNSTFYTFSCYYLPQNANCSNITNKDLEKSVVNYVGLCASSKSDLVKNSCFDEYYMDWGGEDDDLYVRLTNSGCKKEHMKVDIFPVFHQWHVKHSPSCPSPWYLEMVNYLYSVEDNENTQSKEYGVLVETGVRTIISRINEYDCFKRLELVPNPLFQFNLFLDEFFKMASGQFAQFDFPVQLPRPKGRKQKLVDKLNKRLISLNFPYFLAKNSCDVPVHNRGTWFDFVQYFIGRNRPFLQDYYLINTDKSLKLLLQKK